MKKKYRAFALFSGGLDSIIAVLWMEKIGVEVIPVFFKTPFFGPEKASKVAEELGLKIEIIDVSEIHIEMIKNPRYGFGKYFNPCIDCHGLMFREAVKRMEEYNVDFIISGEVVGQRPMSQRADAMRSVSKLSDAKDLIIRPLCQKLLEDTKPIREGWIKKEDLLDIQGRSRTRQIELAKELGVKNIPSSGGGCLLTEKQFSRRLQDLYEHDMMTVHNCDFLKYARHFRISDNLKLMIGKNKSDNNFITEICDERDLVIKTKHVPGPLGILNYKEFPTEEEMKIAGSILLRYNNKANDVEVMEYGKKFELVNDVETTKYSNDELKQYIINY